MSHSISDSLHLANQRALQDGSLSGASDAFGDAETARHTIANGGIPEPMMPSDSELIELMRRMEQARLGKQARNQDSGTQEPSVGGYSPWRGRVY